MTPPNSRQRLPRAQMFARQTVSFFERFMQVQASSGIVLLIAAATALIWANSPFAASYHDFWHAELGIHLAGFNYTQSLHFWVNDALMTFFFLIVGMEVRYEIHAGSLNSIRAASLPVIAAFGGVLVPALVYLGFNHTGAPLMGWAIPTATDIAFAIGLLALLGPGIPHNVRVFLLALAVIDDIVAVLIIAVFYSGGLDISALPLIGLAIILVLLLNHMGVNAAWVYVLPGFLLWLGVLKLGAHPTLAGVVLGLMTPVLPLRRRIHPLNEVKRFGRHLMYRQSKPPSEWVAPLHNLQRAQRDLLPPVIRMQSIMHPWVAFVVMPAFAFANAGITLGGLDLTQAAAASTAIGVGIALILGKPVGILLATWLTVKSGISHLPEGLTWKGVMLVGLFAGIGFTMSIFIAILAFGSHNLLDAAKLGVLSGSVISGVLGLLWGLLFFRNRQA